MLETGQERTKTSDMMSLCVFIECIICNLSLHLKKLYSTCSVVVVDFVK